MGGAKVSLASIINIELVAASRDLYQAYCMIPRY